MKYLTSRSAFVYYYPTGPAFIKQNSVTNTSTVLLFRSGCDICFVVNSSVCGDSSSCSSSSCSSSSSWWWWCCFECGSVGGGSQKEMAVGSRVLKEVFCYCDGGGLIRDNLHLKIVTNGSKLLVQLH